MNPSLSKIKSTKTTEELLKFSIINIDKPAKFTSFDVVNKLRYLFKAKKVGHFGTLDPMVTGVLPIAINKATRLTPYFMNKDKTYIGKFRIHKPITETKLKSEMKKFLGIINQLPPQKSRVKRQIRERKITTFKIIKKHEKIVEFITEVQAGTYIRKLISDLGEKIGGAHMTELRRIKAGIFEIKDSHTINEVVIAFKEHEKGNDSKLRKILNPAEIITEILPTLKIKKSSIPRLLNGSPILKKDIITQPKEDIYAIFHNNQFIEIAKKIDHEDIALKPEFVLN